MLRPMVVVLFRLRSAVRGGADSAAHARFRSGEMPHRSAEVVLTNSSDLPRNRRRGVTRSRGRKVRIITARGLYHQEWQGRPAWIEIFVDNALKGWERGLWLRIPLVREGRIGDVLFHEIGHHIHFAIRPEFREKEDVADVWMVRLSTKYLQKRFPLLRWSLQLFRPWMLGLRNRVMKRALKTGMISRAEYKEAVGPAVTVQGPRTGLPRTVEKSSRLQ